MAPEAGLPGILTQPQSARHELHVCCLQAHQPRTSCTQDDSPRKAGTQEMISEGAATYWLNLPAPSLFCVRPSTRLHV